MVLRICAERPSAFSISAREQGFLLAPEQTRQMIRDLSATVLTLDAKRNAGFDFEDSQLSRE